MYRCGAVNGTLTVTVHIPLYGSNETKMAEVSQRDCVSIDPDIPISCMMQKNVSVDRDKWGLVDIGVPGFEIVDVKFSGIRCLTDEKTIMHYNSTTMSMRLVNTSIFIFLGIALHIQKVYF
ncbi:uncharacterized protein LOC134271586 [Saccostrea cucullata]|uniref:uncharacterized protein LOC134271586 n=1 Tax=Saccostrea cuccullata TaxID=36930 RepID=UPI002ED1FF3B